MKKVILGLLLVGFAVPVQAITLERTVKCIFAPGKYSCSDKEKKEATAWLIGASATAIAAAAGVAAAIFGIKYATAKRNIESNKAKNNRMNWEDSADLLRDAKGQLSNIGTTQDQLESARQRSLQLIKQGELK